MGPPPPWQGLTEDELNFPWQNNLILLKKVSGIDKVGKFKDF